jgi:hypothetical protein
MEAIGCTQFDLNLAKAVVEQMVAAFDALEPVALSSANLLAVPPAPGVYQLLHRRCLVYVGQAADTLQGRLERHRSTLSGRRGIAIEDMQYRALVVNRNWSTLATEQALLSHYRGSPAWNNSGFGSNDPGRNRDQTAEKSGHFNVQFPINIDFPAVPSVLGLRDARVILERLKETAPFIIRFDSSAIDALRRAEVPEVSGNSIAAVLTAIGQALGPNWQVSALPGRVLIYRESGQAYPNAVVVWPKQW